MPSRFASFDTHFAQTLSIYSISSHPKAGATRSKNRARNTIKSASVWLPSTPEPANEQDIHPLKAPGIWQLYDYPAGDEVAPAQR